MKIPGSVIIVTGASSGIGLATAELLAEKGAKVVLAARSVGVLEKLAEKLPGSLALPTDMTDLKAVRAMVKATIDHYDRVDGLVNNAGRGYEAGIEAITPEDFDAIFHLNVLGPIVAMQEVIPVMRKQGGGSIVNISSGTSLMKIPRYSIYSSSKRALNGVSLTVREEVAADKIAVSLVYPSITATHFGVNKLVAGERTEGVAGPNARYENGDSAEYVAGIILKALEEGEAEYFAHAQMRHLA